MQVYFFPRNTFKVDLIELLSKINTIQLKTNLGILLIERSMSNKNLYYITDEYGYFDAYVGSSINLFYQYINTKQIQKVEAN